MLLAWRGRRDGNESLLAGAALIESAIERVLDDPNTRTRDIGGQLGTDMFTAEVCAAIRAGK